MSKINVLTPDIFNKISAGEVIENPVGAVKELVENSVDAGATRISVDIEDGGFEKIVIADNGSGISADDIENAFKKHATSKISKIDDLYKVETLGFRGEALSSIAAVSKIELTTKTADEDAAIFVALEGGQIVEKSYTSSNIGTKFVVKDLFFNTPARKKFFKSATKEGSEITKYITKFILTNPNLCINYVLDGVNVFSSNGKGIENAIYTIYGNECLKNCLKIDYENQDIKIYGYIGSPDYAKANRTYQTISVNGRPISDFGLTSVIAQAYKPYLMTRKYAFFVLNIEIEPQMVDVNVHPKKTEVRFARQDHVYGAVYHAVSDTLKSYSQKRVDDIFDLNSVGKYNSSETKNSINLYDEGENNNIDLNKLYHIEETLSEKDSSKRQDEFFDNNGKSLDTLTDDLLSDLKNEAFDNKDNQEKIKNFADFDENTAKHPSLIENMLENRSAASVNQQRLQTLDDFSQNILLNANDSFDKEIEKDSEKTLEKYGAKIIGVAFNTYLIVELDNKIIFIDQHAAHERILYEKFCKRERSFQNLLFPYVFTVKNDEAFFINNNIDNIKSAGIEIEQFGFNTFRIVAVDSILTETRFDKFVEYLLGSVDEFKIDDNVLIVEKLAKMACKAAIKAGYLLSNDEINSLIEQIIEDKITQCPHGRPIFVVFTKAQIEKMFKRIV